MKFQFNRSIHNFLLYGLVLVLISLAGLSWPLKIASFFLLIIPITLAGLFNDWKESVILTIFSALGGLAILVAEKLDFLHTDTVYRLPFALWLVGCLAFITITIALGIAARKIEENQTLTRNEFNERHRLEEKFSLVTERLEILHKIDKAILESNSPEDIAQAALVLIHKLLPFQRASIVTFDFDANEAKVIAAVQATVQVGPGPGTVFTIQDYEIAPELLAGKIRLVKDAETLDEAQTPGDVLKSMNVLSFASIPLKVENNLIGALNMAAIPERILTAEHLDIASEIADTIAIAIQDSNLHEKTRQNERLLAGLYSTALAINTPLDISILVKQVFLQVKRMINPDVFILMQADPDENVLRILLSAEGEEDNELEFDGKIPLDENSLSGWVLQEKRTLLIKNMDNDPLPVKPKHGAEPAKSWLGVPLISNNLAIGVMSIQSYTYNTFNQDHQLLLESLAALVAIALKNAELFSETTRQLDRIQSLYEIDKAITSNDELGIVAETILDQTISQLKVDAAAILVWNPTLNVLHSSSRKGFLSRQTTGLFPRLDEYLNVGIASRQTMLAFPDLTHVSEVPNIPPNEGFQAYFSTPLFAKGEFQGLLEIYHRQPLHPNTEWLSFLKTLAGQAAIAIHSSNLIKHLQNKNLELSIAYDRTLEGWARALELRDQETEGHSRRVVKTTVDLAHTLGFSEDELEHIRRGALLHDIGKMGIPDSILLKDGKLSEDEWEIMRRHPEYAYDMLTPIDYLRPALEIPYCHHEKWDGTGYPRGLKDEEIPFAARIFAIVDVWDALTNERPYRPAWSKEKTLGYIHEQNGKHFDPKVVDAFLKLLNKSLQITD